MTLLTRKSSVGIAKETVQGTYVAPVRFVPQVSAKPEDVITPLRDESIQSNDAVLQNVYGGPSYSTFEWSVPHLYPDILGDYLRAILGPDTLTAGATTTLSSASIVGATSISTVATIPAGSTIMIDTGANVEYAVTGTPTGSGPFTIPITTPATGLTKAHNSAVAVMVAASHLFKQDNRANPIPTYSITHYDVAETRGYPGSTISDLSIKIDPKGAVTVDPKWTGWPSAVQTHTAEAWTGVQPFIGWQWTLTQNGVSSTRGINLEIDLKRAVEPIDSSDGAQGPREIWADSLECDFKLKAIFENNTDEALFFAYQNMPMIITLTQPTPFGGAQLAVTSSAHKFTKFARDTSGKYLMVDIEGSSSFNTTDSGVVQATLRNFINTAY